MQTQGQESMQTSQTGQQGSTAQTFGQPMQRTPSTYEQSGQSESTGISGKGPNATYGQPEAQTGTSTTTSQQPSTNPFTQTGASQQPPSTQASAPQTAGTGQAGIQSGQTAPTQVEQRLKHDQLPHMTSVFIAGATGSVGCAVLNEMIRDGFDRRMNVIVGIHNSQLPEEIHQWCERASTRTKYFDANDAKTLDLRGVDILFLIPSNDVNRVQQTMNLVNAAKSCNVKYILLLSAVGADKTESVWTKEFNQIERIVTQSHIPCTFIRISWLIENLFLEADSIRNENIIYLPIDANMKFSPLSVIDVGKACCEILHNPESHLNVSYELTGSYRITPEELSEDASRALGRTIQFRFVSADDMLEMKLKSGYDENISRKLIEYLILLASSNYVDLNTSDFYRALTNDVAINPELWFKIHQQEFLPTQVPTSSKRPVNVEETTRPTGREQPIGVSAQKPTTSQFQGDEGCSACGMNPKMTKSLVNLVEAMADSYEDWFRKRDQTHTREEHHYNQLIKLRKQLRQALGGRLIGSQGGRENQQQQYRRPSYGTEEPESSRQYGYQPQSQGQGYESRYTPSQQFGRLGYESEVTPQYGQREQGYERYPSSGESRFQGYGRQGQESRYPSQGGPSQGYDTRQSGFRGERQKEPYSGQHVAFQRQGEGSLRLTPREEEGRYGGGMGGVSGKFGSQLTGSRYGEEGQQPQMETSRYGSGRGQGLTGSNESVSSRYQAHFR